MKQFALIGYPLGHSLSPVIHNELFNLSNVIADYKLIEVPKEVLKSQFDDLKRLSGFNVTIPNKIEIIECLDKLNDKASLFGAVNTVNFENGQWVGYNTDCIGFLNALSLSDINLSGNVLICGAGGVSRMIAFESVLAGCNVTIATRKTSIDKANELKDEIMQKLEKEVSVTSFDEIQGNFDLLVNGTPVGMHPKTGVMAVSESVVKNCGSVFDTIYNPSKTLLIETAEKYGINACDGMAMLVGQAAEAQKIWLGSEFTESQILSVIETARNELK